ncbi:MAG: DUF362 domain-containing protein [Anaeromyxobacter sp.]
MDGLGQRGFTGVALAGAAEGGFAARAARAGLIGETPDGFRYDLVDLSEDLLPAPFPPGCVLEGSLLARAWLEADLRIAFPKARTHDEEGYALALHGLLAALPQQGHRHDRQRQRPWDQCLELLRHTPVGFTVVDAWTSADGLVASPERLLPTRTLIAGRDLLLVDWVAAVKMGLDPQVSRLSARALAAEGLPGRRELVGDLSPFAGFRPVHPWLAESFRARRDAGDTAALAGPLAALAQRAGDRLAAAADGSALAGAALAWVNHAVAAVGQGRSAWRTLADKEALPREEVPLALDLAAYGPEDYEAVPGYLLPLEALIRATPPDEGGLRWRYLEGSVLFEYGQVVPVPFEAFTARVDIARAVQCMKDYMGGRSVAVARDEAGRIIHQAERTRYLPQPNWLVLSGGQPIDVGKLERIQYGEREQRIFWRTVASDNGSARYDDGIVTFAAEGSGTRVTVLARQAFALPPAWQALRLELWPEVKDPLVGREYLAYFRETLTNFQARYEGQDLRVGRAAEGPEPAGGPAAAVGAAARSAARAVQALARSAAGATASPPPQVDADGFSHFTPAPDEPGVAGRPARALRWAAEVAVRRGPEVRTFLAQLRDALEADLGRRRGP